MKSIPEVVEHMKEFRERRATVLHNVRLGRMPWLLADTGLGNGSYWSWVLRTQPVGWMTEDPVEDAALTLYATNLFRIEQTSAERSVLVEIPAPTRGTAVVADL